MGRHGVDARETLGGNLLRGLTLSNGLHNLHLRSGQDAGSLLFLLLGDEGLQRPLAKIPRVAAVFDTLRNANLTPPINPYSFARPEVKMSDGSTRKVLIR